MRDEQIQIHTTITELPGDMFTPVGLYMSLRTHYPQSLLLESTDFQPDENCFSYLCVDPIAGFRASGKTYSNTLDGPGVVQVEENQEVFSAFKKFKNCFIPPPCEYPKGVVNGLFGYITFNSVQYFEDIVFKQAQEDERSVPDICYDVYRFVIVINHYRHTMYLLENSIDAKEAGQRELLMQRMKNVSYLERDFAVKGEEQSNMKDEDFLALVDKCKKHIQRGDVFQIVPSRRFATEFEGDEFNVYRALRSINPSPYLFYFDYGDYRIFGSSPEAEVITREGKAEIFPIAGTAPRSTSLVEEEAKVKELLSCPKENAEHVMLVDLARNDLSKHCLDVKVDSFREVHYYSHVIHLVSKVSGVLKEDVSSVDLLADTFPAGTLSGAPKYRALELLDEYEHGHRSCYGGALGFLGFDNESHHAIIIRSFLSKNGKLFRQAGAGIVIDSVPQKELEEVNNKLGALKAALQRASEFVHEEESQVRKER